MSRRGGVFGIGRWRGPASSRLCARKMAADDARPSEPGAGVHRREGLSSGRNGMRWLFCLVFVIFQYFHSTPMQPAQALKALLTGPVSGFWADVTSKYLYYC